MSTERSGRTREPNGAKFKARPEVIEAVNAALHLRRPLMLTGRPGSGKSMLIESVANELSLGRVLRWHVTSSSTLNEALYRYDAVGRLQELQLKKRAPDITEYLTLGPLGTALLPTGRPRALLIDEIDKADIDLPNDLLNVFERGEFEIPELARVGGSHDIREAPPGTERFTIHDGHVRCAQFPFVVLTSNGERDFPAAFLRRCIRLRMPPPDVEPADRHRDRASRRRRRRGVRRHDQAVRGQGREHPRAGHGPAHERDLHRDPRQSGPIRRNGTG